MLVRHAHTGRVRHFLAVGVAVALAASTSASDSASAAGSHLTKLTFSQAVALPGVVLPAGTYVFSLATPATSHDLVRVVRDTGDVVYAGFTVRVERPKKGSLDPTVTFREAPPGTPVPIAAWYAQGLTTGHQFMYH